MAKLQVLVPDIDYDNFQANIKRYCPHREKTVTRTIEKFITKFNKNPIAANEWVNEV